MSCFSSIKLFPQGKLSYSRKNIGFGARQIWVQTLALPFMSCVTLGKFLNLAKFEFPFCTKSLVVLTPSDGCEDYLMLIGKIV